MWTVFYRRSTFRISGIPCLRKKVSVLSHFKQLAKSIREFKRPTILTVLFIIAEVLLECLIPFITANLVNDIKAGKPMNTVIQTGVLLIIMALFSLACGGIAGFTCAKASSGFARNLRHDIFEKIQSFSFSNVDRFSESSLVTRMTTDISNVQMAFMMIIRTAIRCPLMIVFSVTMAFIMGGALAATFVVVIPVLLGGMIYIAKHAMPAFRAVFKKYDALNESIEENVRAMRVVKGFVREPFEKQKFNTASDNIRKDFTRAERIVAVNTPLMQFCVYFNMIFVLLFGAKIIVTSQGTTIDVGQITAMLSYGMQVLMSLMMVGAIYVILTMSVEGASRICEVLNEEPSIINPTAPVTEVKDGSISFQNVSFKYSSSAKKYALSDINLEIRSGMTVGILGGTGSGKTTLIQLIPRLYDVSEGIVTVGGRNVREYDLNTLRNSVSVVLQKNLLFAGTIRENLCWGNPGASDDEIREACRLAQIADYIETKPEGYERKIEQGGSNISGGQKQRLCIARALLKNPKILILDDSTSAVDMKTDALIRAGFKSYIPNTTKIIIAQRVASVMDSDLIVIMENGKIAASGKHDELLKTCRIYREIYDQQTSGGDHDE